MDCSVQTFYFPYSMELESVVAGNSYCNGCGDEEKLAPETPHHRFSLGDAVIHSGSELSISPSGLRKDPPCSAFVESLFYLLRVKYIGPPFKVRVSQGSGDAYQYRYEIFPTGQILWTRSNDRAKDGQLKLLYERKDGYEHWDLRADTRGQGLYLSYRTESAECYYMLGGFCRGLNCRQEERRLKNAASRLGYACLGLFQSRSVPEKELSPVEFHPSDHPTRSQNAIACLIS